MERDFWEMLPARQIKADSLLCVGLDSDYREIPHADKDPLLIGVAQTDFTEERIEITHDLVCAFKPNLAFYEEHGPMGYHALQESIEYIHEAAPDVPVILDFKRGDIGSTNIGYVTEAFDYFGADAVTVHPYLGGESLKPLLDRKNKGIFILCRTSNPGAGEFQDLPVPIPGTGRHAPLYQFVAHRVATEWNKNGNCGLVVGATAPEELRMVRNIVGDMTILAPGAGEQGGDVEKTVRAGVNSNGRGLIVSSSRGIIFAKDPRAEAIKLRDKSNLYRTEKERPMALVK